VCGELQVKWQTPAAVLNSRRLVLLFFDQVPDPISLLILFFFLLGPPLKKKSSVVSNSIWMKFDRNVPRVNAHRLTYNFKSVAMASFRADKKQLLQREFSQAGAAAWRIKITHSVCRRPALMQRHTVPDP